MNEFWNDGTSLYHYGIPGQRWGQRRFQNEDGTYTEEGKIRYGRGGSVGYKDVQNAKVNYWKTISNNRKSIKQARKDAKNLRKAAYKNIVSTEKDYNKNLRDAKNMITSTNGRIRNALWNNAAKDRAAEYYVNSNSPISSIRKKIDYTVLRNTVAAGLLLYGAYKLSELKEDKAFMNDLNSKIKTGKSFTDYLQDNMLKVGDSGGKNPISSGSAKYWGNDNKLHEARVGYKYDNNGRVTESRYTNYDADKQHPVTLKEAKKLRRGKK